MKSLLALLAVLAPLVARGAGEISPPRSIPELRQRIERLLADTGTPGAGIALVGREGPIWVDGVGLADVAQDRSATEDTLFRIGSTSKSFVALAVLQLQQEGRLDLQDTLRSRAPEIEFNNPWEATDPIRIVHLLEHTTGWDDNAPQEAAWNPTPEPMRREALAYFPRSRTSRWRPGTSFSYSNIGPAVAAYVVEKVTGEKFEDYVARTWFKPLGMTGAAYFNSPEVLARLATGYQPGKNEPIFFRSNVIMRPTGGISASPRDMANYVEFYLNRGSFRGNRLLPHEAIDRMERPTSTYAAAEGFELGYGLNNYTTVWRNWVFHGHGGVVPGAQADMAYLPDEHVGYALMINCENGNTMYQLEEVVRAYLLRDRKSPSPPPPTGAADEAQMAGYAGWYEPITLRSEREWYLESILGLTHVTSANGQLVLRDLTNGKTAYVRIAGRLYRGLNNSRTLVLVGDQSDGTLFQFAGGNTFRRLPKFTAALKLGFALATALLMGSTVIFALVWLPRRLCGSLKDAPNFSVRTYPLIATLFGSAVFILIWEVSGNYFARANGPGWSGNQASSVYHVAHGAFAWFAIDGLIRAVRHRRTPMLRLVWWHSFATSLVLTAWAVYLVYWGLRAEFAI